MFVLSSTSEVIRALVTFIDWWQPTTTSVYRVGGRRNRGYSDGMPSGLLSTLSVREELSRRMQQIAERDRELLYLWYLRQLSADEISRELRLSRRQCFRRRAAAIRLLVELGEPPDRMARYA